MARCLEALDPSSELAQDGRDRRDRATAWNATSTPVTVKSKQAKSKPCQVSSCHRLTWTRGTGPARLARKQACHVNGLAVIRYKAAAVPVTGLAVRRGFESARPALPVQHWRPGDQRQQLPSEERHRGLHLIAGSFHSHGLCTARYARTNPRPTRSHQVADKQRLESATTALRGLLDLWTRGTDRSVATKSTMGTPTDQPSRSSQAAWPWTSRSLGGRAGGRSDLGA
jgi:hypothetical protein